MYQAVQPQENKLKSFLSVLSFQSFFFLQLIWTVTDWDKLTRKKSLMVVKNRPEGEIISAHWFCWWYWWGLRLGQHSLMVLVSFVLQKLFYFHYLCLKIPFGPNEGWQFPHCHTCFCIIKYPSEGWRNTNTTPRDGKQIPTDQQSDKNQMFIEKGNSKWILLNKNTLDNGWPCPWHNAASIYLTNQVIKVFTPHF